MEIDDATEFLRQAVGDTPGRWADFGAGTGTFTAALSPLIGPNGVIYAVDADAGAVRSLDRLSVTSPARVIPIKADFTQPLTLPGIDEATLDGILFANSLHFVRDADVVLTRLARLLRPGGRVVLVEYDRRQASRWVPYPIPAARWPDLARSAGLTNASITATRPSEYSGILYAASATLG